MRREAVTIGIDIGTSGAKAVLLSANGAVLARAGAAYPLLTPRPGWTEQEPEAWWRASVTVLRQLKRQSSGHEIAGIGLSGQMHGSVFLDAAGEPIRPALLWNDARTHDECDEIERRLGRERVIAITGNRASTGFQAPKLLWLRRNELESASRVAKLVLPKDFIRFRLTGEHATDAADASGTLLLDLRERRYSEEILAALEVPADLLPPVFEGPAVTGG
jgi:xylulokinase